MKRKISFADCVFGIKFSQLSGCCCFQIVFTAVSAIFLGFLVTISPTDQYKKPIGKNHSWMIEMSEKEFRHNKT